MKILAIIAFFVSNILFCQSFDKEFIFPHWVSVKDTIVKAYDYYCISNHPNCWAGVGKKFAGLDTLRIFRTYVKLKKDTVLANEKIIYISYPKGSGSEIFGDTFIKSRF